MKKNKGKQNNWQERLHQTIQSKPWLLYAWVLGLPILTYFQVLGHDFVNFDDSTLIYNNEMVTQSTFPLREIFTWGLYDGHYKPLVFLTWWTEYQLFGNNPSIFHFNNLLFHCLNVLLVLWISRSLLKNFQFSEEKVTLGAILIATLFAIHPLHVESVAWAVERKDVMFSFFYLSAWLTYIRYLDDGKKYLLLVVAVLYLASMLSKSMGITLLPILLITDYAYRRRDWQMIALEKIPVVISLLIGAYLFGLIGPSGEFGETLSISGVGAAESVSIFDKIQIQSTKYILWLIKIFIPANLSVIYFGEETIRSVGAFVYLAPLLLGGLLLLVYSLRKKRPELLFGLLFFSIALAPTLAISLKSGIGVFLSDRYTYIPMLGVFLLVVPTVLRWPSLEKKNIALLALGLPILVLLITAFRTVQVWENSETLWTNAIDQFERNPTAYSGRGKFYLDQEQYDQALVDLDKALRYYPGMPAALFNRANLMIETNNFPEALATLDNYLEVDPDNMGALRKRAIVKTELKQYADAMQDIEKALEVNAELPSQYLVRADIHIKTKRLEQALEDIETIIELDSTFWSAYQKRALVYEMQGKPQAALESIDQAITFNDKEPVLFNNRAALLFQMGREEEALRAADQSLLLDPTYARALETRKKILAAQGITAPFSPSPAKRQPRIPSREETYKQLKEQAENLKKDKKVEPAIDLYSKLIELAPDNFSNYVERGVLYLNSERNELAIEDFTRSLQLEPDFSQVYFFRSLAYYGLEQYKAAMVDAKLAKSQGEKVDDNYIRLLESKN